MISLCPTVFDITAPLVLSRTEGSRVSSLSRRVTRMPTLDGGAEITDSGFSEADRTFEIVHFDPTPSEVVSALALARNYGLLLVAMKEGVFLGAIQEADHRDDQLVMTILVSEKLTA